MFAPTSKDLDSLSTREFLSDPNFHNNPNVTLVGDQGGKFGTAGAFLVEFTWKWDWKPPKQAEDKGGGWKTMCTFVEYNQRSHQLETLAAFGVWVQNTTRRRGSVITSPNLVASPPQGESSLMPPRIRLPSNQSHHTVMSDSEAPSESGREPPSPIFETDMGVPINQASTNMTGPTMIDVNCARPGEDITSGEDGPLFRATMKSYEQKTGNMKLRMKKILKKAEAAQQAQTLSNDAMKQFMEALQEASKSNANAVQPALEHYFGKIAKQILQYEQGNSTNLQKLIIDPISKLYTSDIKQADSKRKDFEDESKDFYSYVSRYLGQRQEGLKEKKRAESDTKYQTKRRNFELKRFDYSSFMQDLHGGKKDQEVLAHLTRYADTQAKSYLATAKRIEPMMPQLDALVRDVSEVSKDYQIQRTEREEKRRTIEASSKPYNEPDSNAVASAAGGNALSNAFGGEGDLGRSNSGNRPTPLTHSASVSGKPPTPQGPNGLTSSQSVRLSGIGMPSPAGDNRFKGIRDLEDKAPGSTASQAQRKEGLVWALSRPGSHIDPRGINKQAWHKFWLVLDAGKLSEYTNWKERLELHMDPIDLRLASVREARDSDRRFCFEVITPNFKRVYQAQSEEDMKEWIGAVNNALQSAFEGRNQPPHNQSDQPGLSRDIGSVLTGKSPSNIGHSLSQMGGSSHANSNVGRRTTVGARPSYLRSDSNSYSEDPTKLLREIRAREQGNVWCADCGSDQKTEWVSINLGIIVCIECSGIHRSLGTHISKMRSLTLDTSAFTSDIVEIIMQIGNRLSNQIWEARLDPNSKPLPTANREQRLRFIQAKYVERAYVDPLTAGTADDLLIMSVKINEIQKVLKALALGASPNAHDKSRNTHAIFLALAAADPALPASASPSASPRLPSGQQAPAQSTKKAPAFPIAEMLLQNGGEIPLDLPTIPLSPAAKLFVDQRRPRSGGTAMGAGMMSPGMGNGSSAASGDTLTALPNFGVKSPGTREREKLRKRDSGGGGKFSIGGAF